MVPARRASAARIFFGDRRLHRRLLETFDQMILRPDGTLPRKLSGRAELVGGYRMFNNPKVTHRAILQSHRTACLGRLAERARERAEGPLKVLILHDTTALDYSGLTVEGLGQVGNGHGKGLYAHHALAVIPRTREVVGLLNQILHVRARAPKGESRSKRAARSDRESRLWKRGVAELPAMPPGVVATDVSDRGSDLTEHIAFEIEARRTFIVRSQHDRNLAGDGNEAAKLHERLRGLCAAERWTLEAPKAEGGRRRATVELAWERVTILPPRQRRGEHGSEPIQVVGVIVREVDPPEGQEPIEWILLTNRTVESAEQAREVVEDYALRWMIEEYHKAQKTGCGIEELQLTTRHGLDNAIALLSVLATHVLRLRCAARDEATRDQPARLHEGELKVRLAARDAKHPDWRSMTVFEFYIAVAKMGGYMLNPRKRPPGWLVLWRGYVRLEDMCQGVRLMSERCVQT